MDIETLIKLSHENAKAKGFWDEPRDVGAMLMLIVTELAEAMEAHRHGDEENFAEEIADTFIRLGDLCGGLNIDRVAAIENKMIYNATRPRLHGKRL